MKITKRKEFIYKNIGDIKEDDEVLTPDGKKHKVFSIQEQGNSDIYKIYISDGRVFRTHQKHLTPVCFRQKNRKEVWDCLTTEWMQKYIDKFHFTIIDNYSDLKVDDKYSLFYEHDAEPDDNIEPIVKDGPYITKIEKLNYSENCRCISLFDPEGLYYTNNGIITHNSTLSTLIQLFISTHYAMMWHPWKYFNLAPSSVFTQCMGAWNQKKASELLVEPFIQILEQSPYFKRVRSHTDLVDAAGEDLAEHICWTTSSPTSVLQLQNGVNYKIINGPGSILGQNIISAVISEMTMFTENGWALDLEEPILMADGSIKKMGDIQIGDKLAHPENKENIVLKIPYEKTTTEYEITLDNGKTIKCNSWHIWKVSFRKDKNGNPIYELVTTQFMIDHPELEFDIPEIDEKMLKSFHNVLAK